MRVLRIRSGVPERFGRGLTRIHAGEFSPAPPRLLTH